VRSEALTVVSMKMAVFCVVAPCSLPPSWWAIVSSWWRQQMPLNVGKLLPHYTATTQKTAIFMLSEISRSHSSKYEGNCVLGCSTVQSGRGLVTFHCPGDGGTKYLWNSFNRTTPHNIPEDSNFHQLYSWKLQLGQLYMY
jgi:hypothetical protein